MSDDVILQYLQSIEGKIDDLKDDLSPRVNKVEAWQSNADGKLTAFGAFCVTIGGIVGWLVSLIKH